MIESEDFYQRSCLSLQHEIMFLQPTFQLVSNLLILPSHSSRSLFVSCW